MQIVGQGWLVLQLTDSPFYLGLVGLVRAVPTIAFSLVGGVLADRFDRRRILLVTQSVAGGSSILLASLTWTGVVTVWQILAIAFDSGFNSKTTFNTVFKKFTGFTPSDFKEQHPKNPVGV
jgi:AraC-like DNA-binding protein